MSGDITSITSTRSMTTQARAASPPSEPASAPDRTSVTHTSTSLLDMQEHNDAQLEVMRRMGVNRKDTASMLGWIRRHAKNFGDAMGSKDSQASAWRQMLRAPESRGQALDAIHQYLLTQPPPRDE